MEPIDALVRTINTFQSQLWREACAYEETFGLEHLAARANKAAEASDSSFGKISYASLSAVTNFVNNATQGTALFTYEIFKTNARLVFNLIDPSVKMDQVAMILFSDVWDLGSGIVGGLYQVFVHDSHSIKQAYHENDLVLGTEKAVDLLLNIVSLGFAIKGLRSKPSSQIEAVGFSDSTSGTTAKAITEIPDNIPSMWNDMPSHEFNLYDHLGFNDPSTLPMFRIQYNQSASAWPATMAYFGVIYASGEKE